MWEKQSQQAQWKTPGRESRRQRAARAAEDMSALLFVQVMLCLLVCAAALAFKWLNAPFFPQMQAQYGEMLERGVAFSSEHPIVRFAGDALETMQNRMRSALGAFSAAQDAGGGQGGFWPAESESVPDGASTQDYTLASQPVRPAQGGGHLRVRLSGKPGERRGRFPRRHRHCRGGGERRPSARWTGRCAARRAAMCAAITSSCVTQTACARCTSIWPAPSCAKGRACARGSRSALWEKRALSRGRISTLS